MGVFGFWMSEGIRNVFFLLVMTLSLFLKFQVCHSTQQPTTPCAPCLHASPPHFPPSRGAVLHFPTHQLKNPSHISHKPDSKINHPTQKINNSNSDPNPQIRGSNRSKNPKIHEILSTSSTIEEVVYMG